MSWTPHLTFGGNVGTTSKTFRCVFWADKGFVLYGVNILTGKAFDE